MRRVRIVHLASVLAAGIGLATLGQSAVSGKSWAQDSKPIRIALLAGLSGVYGDLTQGEAEAMQLAVEDVGGKVLGRPVEILSADHQNKPDIAASVARKWDDEGVRMITGLDTLPVAQGLVLTEAFYWDQSDETRAWTKRFRAKKDKIPNMQIAGAYSATLHYLKAIQAAGTDEPKAVMAKMREMLVNDMMTKNGQLREDGRLIRDMYLFQVKTPAESKGKDDIYKLVATVPGDQAFRPLKDGKCPFIK